MQNRNSCQDLPRAAGPYRHAVRADGLVFVSGQIPVDPTTGGLVGDDIRAATRQVLANLAAVLAAENLTLTDVVKTTVYLADMGDFSAMNEVYAEAFHEPYPARACIQVAALPKNARIEIEAVARCSRLVTSGATGAG
jgi:2-iminobutanoate/2-iminopropanoate deaminase